MDEQINNSQITNQGKVDTMAKSANSKKTGRKVLGTSSDAVETAQAKEAGAKFEWHYGRVTRMGNFNVAGKEVVVSWEEGGVTSQQGGISDEQWDIFKLAFMSTGRIAVLSDAPEDGWMYDYRFLEAVR
jgi:hypothetical protein